MDNIFYANPDRIISNQLELEDQEARHAAKVLRFDTGDEMWAADGKGNMYRTEIASVSKKSVLAHVNESFFTPEPETKKVIAFGAIKKRDRLEFAVEKAVELDAWEICLFNADHSERSKINEDRLSSIALSAFKQSKRSWLPNITFLESMDKVLDTYIGHHIILAHLDTDTGNPKELSASKNLLMVGPEGGFSDREVSLAKERKAECISLGKNRLRAETAVIGMLSQYLFSK